MKRMVGDMVPSEAWVPFLEEAVKVLKSVDARPGATDEFPIDLDSE